MKHQQLLCPECGGQNTVPPRDLAVGRAVHCMHCGVGLYVNRWRPTPDSEPQWRLESMDPLEEEPPAV